MSTPSTWADRHAEATERLGSAQEARWMVEEASGGTWPSVGDQRVLDRPGRRFASMLERRAGGEPLQYVLGRWAFRSIDLMVDRRVLIPRPETEQVVSVALAELAQAAPDRPLLAVDLGTGSGAIALSLLVESPAEVWATDVSADALAVAGANAAGIGRAATRLRLAEGSWWDALPAELTGRVDLAVANPPYVSSGELAGLDPEVGDWEPHLALDAGPVGTEALELVIAGAGPWMAPGGALVLELAPHQAVAVAAAARDAGFDGVAVHADLAGRDRCVAARWPR